MVKLMPRLEKLWAHPDAQVPSWATNGVVYNTFPRTPEMDPDGFAQEWPEMSEVMPLINNMIQEYYNQLGLNPDEEPYIYQMWIHCHTPGADGIEHDHPEFIMSGGMYFQLELDQSNLVVDNKEYSVQTGDIMFWPGDVLHTVLPNKLDTNRIAAAIMVKARPKCR